MADPMIKVLIFDLGGVIVPFDFARGYEAMAPHCPYPAAEIRKRLIASGLVPRLESGRMEPEAFFDEVRALLRLEITYRDFGPVWSSIFLPDTLIPGSLLAALKPRYPLVLLSNTNAIHWAMLWDSYPLLSLFDHLVLSYEAGATKPEPKIYQEAIRRAGCQPQECFFTDDIPAYVEGARRQGIDAVQFTSLAQLEADLRRRGVAW